MTFLKTTAVLFVVAAALGCNPAPPCPHTGPAPVPTATEGPEQILRTYDVPEGYGQEISSTLNRLLSRTDSQHIGQVSLAPNNRVVVVAPESIQEGVVNLLSSMDLDEPVSTDTTIEISYWLVLGHRAETESNPDVLPEIASALREINDSQGPMTFSLLERLSLLSTEFEHASAVGRHLSVRQEYRQVGEAPVIRFGIDTGNNEINTVARLQPDQVLVLGQVGYQPSTMRPSAQTEQSTPEDDDAMLFFIIRPNLVSAQ